LEQWRGREVLPCRADFVELNDMKILMPKEMKIRLVANVLGIVIAFLNAGYAAWYLVTMSAFNIFNIIYLPLPIFSVAAAGLYFLMAKIMWALQKKTKMMGWIVIAAVGALGIIGPIYWLAETAGLSFDLLPVFLWSFGVGMLSGFGGGLIVVGKLGGEMIEKLKKSLYVGFACIAGLVILLVVFGIDRYSITYSHSVASAIGALAMTLGGLAVTILGYWAESVLIKKKFLVYN
jgi:hypothetical protein